MVRENLMAQLKQAGINFPETATIQQLRELLREVVGASSSSSIPPLQQAQAEGPPPSQQEGQQQQADDVVLVETQQPASMPAVTDKSKHAQTTQNETDNIEEQLARHLRILQLKKEISALEEKKEMKKSVATFADVEGAMPKFSGDDAYTISKWVQDFDRITDVIKCTEAEKFIYARRMLTGSAALFLRRTKANSWLSLKKELEVEFQKTVGAKEILRKLDARKWDRAGENLHHYVLIMQELADGAPIQEAELVEYIVDGMQERSVAASIFFNVNTVAEFKALIPKYEKMVVERKQKQLKNSQVDQALAEVRCFNCQKLGHYATSCRAEKRQTGACFKCGKMGHLRIHCPLRAVAAVPDQDEVDWDIQPM
ncbi:uncharacterized protein [Musca autumnalis]|uniref:uncharacterized protein n=1 Tax=Musca autumnalis TaxID=221902 RepID=UPI003CF1A194